MIISSYADADQALQGRCHRQRKLGNNTYLIRGCLHLDEVSAEITVRLHATDVVTYYPNGSIRIRHAGWQTVTTKDRINEYSPGHIRVCSASREWYIAIGQQTYEFDRQSVLIGADGSVSDPPGDLIEGDIWKWAQRKRNKELAEQGVFRLRYWLKQARAHQPGKLTVNKIMDEPNASVRVAMMHAYGLDRFMLDCHARVIDAEAGYELLKIDLSNWEWVTALKMACPSTGAVYINTVPPYIHKVRDGVDWMFDTTGYLDRIGQQS